MDEELLMDGWESDDEYYPCCNDGNCDVCFGAVMDDTCWYRKFEVILENKTNSKDN